MRNNYSLIILLLAAIKLVLPFLLSHPAFELHRDEYLYYEQGQHLAFGYLENPPMIGLLAFMSSLMGGSFFWVKFWPALFGSLTLLTTAGIVKELGGNLFAQVIASLGILLTAYLRIHFLLQPNFLDIFFWTLSAYFLLRFINTKREKYIYLLCFALVLGWWSKYSVLFFVAALFISILLTKHRNIFQNKNFWFGAGLGILFILPNILWQYSHNWPLVLHMGELRDTQLKYINKGDFIKEQLLMLLPVLFVWIGGLIWLLKNNKYRIIGLMYLSVVILLMLGSGKGYYALGAYPMLLAAGGAWVERISVKRKWIRYAAVSLILIFAIPFIPILLPMQSPKNMAATNKKMRLEKLGLLKWEDQKQHPLQQDFADMLGWKQLAKKSENIFQQFPDSIKKNTIVYCRNYGQAGALIYYGTRDLFKKKVISDNGTFLLWIPDELYFKHLLFIGRRMPEKDDEVFQHFGKITIMDSINNPLSRQHGDKIIFFENGSDSVWQLAVSGLKEMKARFGQ
ncbi:MAG TPA: glycosyltransferase family 39 protein [Chitinophagaceae bacterium]|nr:glycosyltransferase family 39 protein [Chitinophagaceae bacterium]